MLFRGPKAMMVPLERSTTNQARELSLYSSTSELGLLRMLAFAEFLNHLFVERRNIVRFAAGHESVIHYYLLIDPIASGIFHIRLNRRPGSQLSSADDSGIDQNPWSMTNGRDWFAFLEEVPGEFQRFRRRSKLIRIHQAAWDHQGVEFPRPPAVEGNVAREFGAFVGVVHSLNSFIRGRNDFGCRTRFFQRLARLRFFRLLEPIGHEYRHFFAVQFSHKNSSC